MVDSRVNDQPKKVILTANGQSLRNFFPYHYLKTKTNASVEFGSLQRIQKIERSHKRKKQGQVLQVPRLLWLKHRRLFWVKGWNWVLDNERSAERICIRKRLNSQAPTRPGTQTEVREPSLINDVCLNFYWPTDYN